MLIYLNLPGQLGLEVSGSVKTLGSRLRRWTAVWISLDTPAPESPGTKDELT